MSGEQLKLFGEKGRVMTVSTEKQKLQQRYAWDLGRVKQAENTLVYVMARLGHEGHIVNLGLMTEDMRRDLKEAYETDKILLEKRLKKQERQSRSPWA